jgi:hypothetical protein
MVHRQKWRYRANSAYDPRTPRKEELFLAQPGGHGVTPIRGVISDLDGVVYRGSQSIPESVKAFQTWQARGVPYAFATNNATKSAAQFAAKLAAMGVPVSAAQVFNAVSATASLMRRRWPPGTRVFAIGEYPLLEELKAGGFTSAGESAEVVVLGFDYALTQVANCRPRRAERRGRRGHQSGHAHPRPQPAPTIATCGGTTTRLAKRSPIMPKFDSVIVAPRSSSGGIERAIVGLFQ